WILPQKPSMEEVKHFKRSSLKKTNTEEKNPLPTEEGMCRVCTEYKEYDPGKKSITPISHVITSLFTAA
uniref:Uncharacterized protein n=1 Tax=Myripristis murdjan TaxID=586833 RepID=A0A667Y2P7_9TELE